MLTVFLLIFLSSIFLLLFLNESLQRFIFKFNMRSQTIPPQQNLIRSEPEIGLNYTEISDIEKKQLMILNNLTSDELATACALKIAALCDQKQKTNFNENKLKPSDLSKLEKKLRTVSLLDALRELDKLDSTSQKIAMERLQIDPSIINSLLRKKSNFPLSK